MSAAIVHRITKLLRGFMGTPPALVYWQERARKYGVRSVLNIAHSEEEAAAQTRFQNGNAPSPRLVQKGQGDVIAIPHLGGLHHRYSRAA